MGQLKAFEISSSVYVACKTSIIIKTKESFPSKVVTGCVFVPGTGVFGCSCSESSCIGESVCSS